MENHWCRESKHFDGLLHDGFVAALVSLLDVPFRVFHAEMAFRMWEELGQDIHGANMTVPKPLSYNVSQRDTVSNVE